MTLVQQVKERGGGTTLSLSQIRKGEKENKRKTKRFTGELGEIDVEVSWSAVHEQWASLEADGVSSLSLSLSSLVHHCLMRRERGRKRKEREEKRANGHKSLLLLQPAEAKVQESCCLKEEKREKKKESVLRCPFCRW